MSAPGTAPDVEDKSSEGSDWTRHRVTDAQRESGIPPARARGPLERTLIDGADDRVQLALAESTRTEANLAALLRGLQHLTAGAVSARDANFALSLELGQVRDLLARRNAEERVLRQRVRLLEQSLERQRRESTHERSAFIDQEDAFLGELLSDHDRELAFLRGRLGQAVARLRKAESLVPVSNPPSTLGSLNLRSVRIPLPITTPDLDDDRLSPPRPASRPPLKLKADPSTRPLVEYSLGRSSIEEEHLGPVPVYRAPETER